MMGEDIPSPAAAAPSGFASTAGSPTAAPVPAVVYPAGATSGVAMTPIPEVLLPSIMDSVKRVCAQIPSKHHNALVARVDLKGANLIIARRFDDSFSIVASMGKTWVGGYDANFQVVKTW